MENPYFTQLTYPEFQNNLQVAANLQMKCFEDVSAAWTGLRECGKLELL